MKLYVKEKLFSVHNKYFLYDETGKEVYEISSKVFSIGDKTKIFDMNGNELAYVEQKLLHLMPTYETYVNGELICEIKKKFSFLKNNYELSNGYRVEGNFMALEFKVFDEQNNMVANISRAFFSIGDKYEMEILDDAKLINILVIIIAITNDIDRSQSSSNN